MKDEENHVTALLLYSSPSRHIEMKSKKKRRRDIQSTEEIKNANTNLIGEAQGKRLCGRLWYTNIKIYNFGFLE
jgi:hypothetical protein